MPGFLKAVFKGRSERSRSTHPQPVASEPGSLSDFSPSDRRNLPTEDLQALAQILRGQEIGDGGARDGSHLVRDPIKREAMQHLLGSLTGAESRSEEGKITPFLAESSGQSKGKAKSILTKMRKGKAKDGGEDPWRDAFSVCGVALGTSRLVY